MKYLLLDMNNLLWRAAFVTRGDNHDKVGLAAHIILNSLGNIKRIVDYDHVVVCYDGASWRKKVDPTYKLNRKVVEQAKSKSEKELSEMLYVMNNDLKEFFETSTNCTVLFNEQLEADDLIAGWTQVHDTDEHIIYSSDKDFLQLISDRVSVYNGMDDTLYTNNKVLQNGKDKVDKKTKKFVEPIDPEYFLFEKIVRGDTSDNIKPAYPGIRKKGSSKRVGIIEAFKDRLDKGFAWNNFMLSTWSDENDNNRIVHDEFKHNELLIDLTKQPDHIKEIIVSTIMESYNKKPVQQIGIKFIKFCGKYNLINLSENAHTIAKILSLKNKDLQ